MQCFILHFVNAIFGFVCKVLRKRGKVLKMYAGETKTVRYLSSFYKNALEENVTCVS